MTRPWIAGIGSRETPAPYLRVIQRFAGTLAGRGVGVRSGRARGADTAWEEGALAAGGAVRRYLARPRRGIEALCPGELDPALAEQAYALAERLHPGWPRLSAYVRDLMARNVMILLGDDLRSPVDGVACWAPRSRIRDGRIVDVAGGTGLGVRLAAERGIPVLNLAVHAHLEHARAWHRAEAEPFARLFDPAALALSGGQCTPGQPTHEARASA